MATIPLALDDGLSMMDKEEEAKRNVAEKLRETLFG